MMPISQMWCGDALVGVGNNSGGGGGGGGRGGSGLGSRIGMTRGRGRAGGRSAPNLFCIFFIITHSLYAYPPDLIFMNISTTT